jgi:hypothetical protein
MEKHKETLYLEMVQESIAQGISCSQSQSAVMRILKSIGYNELSVEQDFISYDDKIFAYNDQIFVQEVFFKFFFCDFFIPSSKCNPPIKNLINRHYRVPWQSALYSRLKLQ